MDSLQQSMRVQKLVLDYFNDQSDYVVAGVIRTIVYNESCTKEIQAITDKFLQDNEIDSVYEKYNLDLSSPKSFTRTSGAERNILSTIYQALLNLSFNRYKVLAKEQKPVAEKTRPYTIKVLNSGEVHAMGTHPDYAVCSLLLAEDIVGPSKLVKTKVNCPQCIEMIKLCKKH